MKWPRLLILILAFGLPAPVRAHIKVVSTVPAADSMFTGALREIRVTFSQGVEPGYTDLVVIDSAGARFTGFVSAVDATNREFTLRLGNDLASGVYTVEWKAAAKDGHVVTGTFAFSVNAPPPPPAIVDPDGAIQEHEHGDVQSVSASPLRVLVRWFSYGFGFLLLGSVVFRYGVLARASSELSPETSHHRSAQSIALLSAAAVLLLALPRLIQQSQAMHGDQLWSVDLITVMIAGTTWGKGWMLQVAGPSIAQIGAVRARKSQSAWAIVGLGALLVAIAPSFSGHAAAVEQSVVFTMANDVVHVVGASAWLGTLGVLFLCALRSPVSPADVAVLVRRFSPVALLAAGVAAATGIFSALTYIGGLSNLYATPYGRALSLKLFALFLAVSAGFVNWRAIAPRLGSQETTAILRRSAMLELGAAILILLATAVLVAMPTP